VWGPTTRVAQLARFLQVRPSALVASASTAQLVDDWADRWKLGRKAACTVSGPERVERLGCLDRGLHELRAQIALWQNADGDIVDHAVQAAAALPQPSECATHPAAALDDTLRDRIAELAALVPRPGSLFVTGGATLARLCARIEARALDVIGAWREGIAVSVIEGGPWDGLPVFSKSGAFGDAGTLLDLVRLSGTETI
jgi:hypothetical protein